jgi:putative FmdB family regulatory protein
MPLDPNFLSDYSIHDFIKLYEKTVFGEYMPIYEYICEKCCVKEEVLQRFDDDAPSICPNCQEKNTLKKIVTRSAFHLKGGGWYKDLYSSAKKPAISSDEKKSSDKKPDKEKKENKDTKKKDDKV